jgi:hypothetical protein
MPDNQEQPASNVQPVVPSPPPPPPPPPPPTTAPPPPSPEQQRYWKWDLAFKSLSLIVSIIGFFFVIYGLRINALQSANVAKSLRVNIGHTIVSHVTDLDKVFMQKPSLVPYFYSSKPITNNDSDYPEVAATAVFVLDVFDLVATQNRYFPEYWDTPQAWDEWMIDVFTTSPILRETIDKYNNWYGDGLKTLRRKAETKIKEKQAQDAKSKPTTTKLEKIKNTDRKEDQ